MQELYVQENVVRFRENKIVRWLLDEGNLSLNDIASKAHLFSQADFEAGFRAPSPATGSRAGSQGRVRCRGGTPRSSATCPLRPHAE